MQIATYVLVDYENIQPSNLELLKDQGCSLRIFVGSSQDKLPLATVTALQGFGKDLEYIQTCGMGHNALDFHIAYFLGVQSSKTPNAKFFVVSRDSGFDPLLRYLVGHGVYSRRVTTALEISNALAGDGDEHQPMSEVMRKVIAYLATTSTHRPRTVRTLRSAINALFQRKLRATDIDDLVFRLRTQGYITEEGTRVSYQIAIVDALTSPAFNTHATSSCCASTSPSATGKIADKIADTNGAMHQA